MHTLTRRDMLTATLGTGAALALPGADLLAQPNLQFTQLGLNNNGRRMLNPAVTALDQHEDQLLDDLLNNNMNRMPNDLDVLGNDFQGLMRNPGNPIGFQAAPFRQQVQQNINVIVTLRRAGLFGRRTIMDVVVTIDNFVGCWYPCNDILEIGVCEAKIWNCLHGRPNWLAIELYTIHMRNEIQSIFRYHPARVVAFQQESVQLLNMVTGFEQQFVQRNFIAGRQRFVQFSVATSLFFRKYYPQWC